MHRPAFSAFVLGAALLLGAGCDYQQGSSRASGGTTARSSAYTPPEAVDAPELAALVPDDTFLYFQVSSLGSLETSVRKLMKKMAPKAPVELDLVEELTGELPIRANYGMIDRERPLGLAFSLPQGMAEPQMTLIVPAAQPEAFVDTVKSLRKFTAPKAQGSYVAVPMGTASYSPSVVNSLGEKMPAGTISMRLDVERFVSAYRPMLDQSLDRAENMMALQTSEQDFGAAAVLDSYFGLARDFLESAEVLEAGFHLDGTEMELAVAFDTLPGSPLALWGGFGQTGLAEITPTLDTDDPVLYVLGLDTTALGQKLQPLLDAMVASYPEGLRTPMQEYTDGFMRLYTQLGPGFAGSAGFDEKGLHAVYVAQCEDPQAFRSGLQALFGEGTQMTAAGVTRVTEASLEGAEVLHVSFELDEEPAGADGQWSSMYGEDGLRLSFCTKGDRVALVVGGGADRLKKTIHIMDRTHSDLPVAFQDLVGRVAEGNPAFAMHMDLGRMMGQAARAMGGAGAFPGLPAKIELPIGVYGYIKGSRWTGGLRLDVAGFASLGLPIQ